MDERKNCNNCFHYDTYHAPYLPGRHWLCSGDREAEYSLLMNRADMDKIDSCNNYQPIDLDEDEE